MSPGSQNLPQAPVRGVVIGGGDDIEPEHYGQNGDAGGDYDPERDRMEIELLKRALEFGVPILGICRGMQLINVVLGGGLYSDIRPKRRKTPNYNSAFPVKWVDISNGSGLMEVLGLDKVKVNSLHHQAVDRVADTLEVCARDQDGFVQAIASTRDQAQILGVQWHPEYMPYSKPMRKLFSAFVNNVAKGTNTMNISALESKL